MQLKSYGKYKGQPHEYTYGDTGFVMHSIDVHNDLYFALYGFVNTFLVTVVNIVLYYLFIIRNFCKRER